MAGTAVPAAHERRDRSDAAGVVVLAAWAVWALTTAAATAGRPEGILLAVLVLGGGYAAGRICGTLLPAASLIAGAGAGFVLALASAHELPGASGPATGGRAGAAVALLVLATGAACCAAWAVRRQDLRIALRAMAVVCVVTAAVLGSGAGAAACAGVLLCSLAAARIRRRGPALSACALAAAAMACLCWATAYRALPTGLTMSLEAGLTSPRLQLWERAAELARADPVLGAGPGRFGELGAGLIPAVPPDAKPHSAPLQIAAEQGVVGVALLAAVFVWLLYALRHSPRATGVVLTAGSALTALAAVAMVGNALSVTSVTAGAGLLAGLATARPYGEEVRPWQDPAGRPSTGSPVDSPPRL